jgi:hypothetical protein
VEASGYEIARFNALRHGVLSRYTVLPWEDECEYRALPPPAFFGFGSGRKPAVFSGRLTTCPFLYLSL